MVPSAEVRCSVVLAGCSIPSSTTLDVLGPGSDPIEVRRGKAIHNVPPLLILFFVMLSFYCRYSSTSFMSFLFYFPSFNRSICIVFLGSPVPTFVSDGCAEAVTNFFDIKVPISLSTRKEKDLGN